MGRDRDEKAQPRGTGAGAERGWGGFQGANPKEGAPLPACTEQARSWECGPPFVSHPTPDLAHDCTSPSSSSNLQNQTRNELRGPGVVSGLRQWAAVLLRLCVLMSVTFTGVTLRLRRNACFYDVLGCDKNVFFCFFCLFVS